MSYKITMEKMINGVRSTVYPKTIVSQVKGIERFIRKFIPADSKVDAYLQLAEDDDLNTLDRVGVYTIPVVGSAEQKASSHHPDTDCTSAMLVVRNSTATVFNVKEDTKEELEYKMQVYTALKADGVEVFCRMYGESWSPWTKLVSSKEFEDMVKNLSSRIDDVDEENKSVNRRVDGINKKLEDAKDQLSSESVINSIIF